jgi:hypothetical protein
MAHGTPDYGVTAGAVAVYQVTDLGELAARLGSPVTHDRRGDIIWWDDFECGLAKWGVSTSGVGGAAALSTAQARNGRTSLLLTAGSTLNHSASASHNNPYPNLSRLGVEVAFQINNLTDTFALNLALYDGTTQRLWTVQYDDVNNRLEYFDGTLGDTTFATGVDLLTGATMFHVLKLVVNASTARYERVVLDERSYNLAGLTGAAVPDAGASRLNVQIVNTGRAGNNDLVYVDDVIITQNEPANG